MSGGKLPEGWVDTQLGNIIELKYGKSLAAQTRDGFGFPVYGSNGVVGKHSIPLINKSGLIVGRKGSYGVVNKSVGPFFPIDTTYYIDDFYNQPLEFLFYYLSFLPLTKLNRSTAIPGLNRDDAYDLNIALPPLAEQKIIAEKLDTLLAQVDSTKARLEQIPQILKRFRQSILTCAIDGTLTSKWRETVSPAKVDIVSVSDEMYQNGITYGNFGKKTERANFISLDELSTVIKHVENWPLIRIGSLCDCIVPNRDKPKTFSGGFHWLLTQNFDDKSIWIDYSKISLGLSKDEVKKYNARIVNKGSVIMTCIGRLGLSAVLEEDSVINQQLHAFIPNKYIKAEYLAYCIRANQNYFKKKSTSTTIDYLNKTACNSLPIPLPSLEEQHEIVRRVEQLFAWADTIEKQVNNALNLVNSLTQSILAKAFRGELTAQWRAENPDLISGENSAAALLEKIKAERAASGGKKTSRKKA
ncbi:TPA: restriction endonuclease subunit S [Salmonella enterica subsp. enterica serovar Wyldegreen]|nr:restriction endonuclease subunit S [Salmonella enterica subsp. enterica serovar Wyldegreen]